MNKPFFSAIIATFNRAEMLREAIQSVLDQTFHDFELIVVDDFSSDNTKDVVDSFRDGRITYIVNDHLKGNSGARNAGIFRAQGEWVAFLDDDDTWLPEKLEKVYEKITSSDDSIGLIYTGFVFYDFDARRQISIHVPEKKGWIQSDLIFSSCIGTPSAVSVRADILKRIEGFDERINHYEDGELYVRIAGLSKIEYVTDVLTLYRTSNKDKVSINIDAKNGLDSFDRFQQKHNKLINKSPRLRHIAASRVFRFAMKDRNIKHILISFPWTIAGLFFDVNNFKNTLKIVFSELIRQDIFRNKL
ncbi:glycosyltransferase family 2 protein [candidate division WS5 bacterium]|uniref:Glycosyltransferase family 2 protein n=1 Tax=candidate division WS5 bacterium TaxID=2093353 RepID=A0A419DCP8_9BACT|nr:MAG: glycosyltransferase family 2 protein [candidate division WS5 bacterium]